MQQVDAYVDVAFGQEQCDHELAGAQYVSDVFALAGAEDAVRHMDDYKAQIEEIKEGHKTKADLLVLSASSQEDGPDVEAYWSEHRDELYANMIKVLEDQLQSHLDQLAFDPTLEEVEIDSWRLEGRIKAAKDAA